MNAPVRILCNAALCLLIGCSSRAGTAYPLENSEPTSPTAGDIFALSDGMKVKPVFENSPAPPTSTVDAIKTGRTATPSLIPSETIPLTSTRQNLKPTQTQRTEETQFAADEMASLAPDAPINIFGPGEGSRVTSPIQVQARLTSKTGKSLRIELRGNDGRLLARILKIPSIFPWPEAIISIPLFFEINDPQENGQLTIRVDDKYGRPMDANSVGLILSTSGQPQLRAHPWTKQSIIILEPSAGSIVKGGTVYVSGLVRADLPMPVNIQLVSVDGRSLGFRLAVFSETDAGAYGVFTAEVPYSVSHHTPVRLIAYTNGMGIDDPSHLSSTEIVLSP